MNVQNAKNLTIEEGNVKTIHDKDNRLLWGAVGYDTKYAGDTFQQTYSGKNLLNVPDGTTSRNNITLDVLDGVLRVHNTGTTTYVAFGIDNNLRHANYAPYVSWNNMTLSAGTYTISTTYVSGSTDTTGASSDFLRLEVSSRAVGDTGLFSKMEASVEINNTNGSATFTLSESKEIIIVVYEYASNKTIDISFKAQLEQGSTATTYEPYVGGTASPNPDYPQNIDVVTGEQTVSVHGKNLFDKNAATSSSTAYWLNQDGTISTSASNSGGWQYMVVHLGSSSYTLSYIPYLSNLTNNNVKIVIKDMDANTYLYNSWDYSAVSGTKYSHSFTVSEAADIGICICPQNSIPSGGSFSFDKVQLEKGSQPTTYEPYQNVDYTIDLGNTELCKIGTYQDYIYKSGDDWYVHKKIGKHTFDGSESWTKAGVAYAYYTTLPNSPILPNANTTFSDIVCDYFSLPPTPTYNSLVRAGGVGDGQTGMFALSTSSLIAFRYDSITSAADFKTWLSTHNTIVYYALATPTDTKITDSTLISELEAIHEWMTRYGYEATVSGNLPLLILQTTLS